LNINKAMVRGHRTRNRIEGMGGKNHSLVAAASIILSPSFPWDSVTSNSAILYPLD
jgi:uncharacterized membrane protein YdjX (TVP38/TMEM64 family)